MRIHRDVRFSKDKSPYYSHLRIMFWEGGVGKKKMRPGFFFGMGSDSARLFGGQHMFDKPVLQKYRNSVLIDTAAANLEEAIAKVEKAGYEVGGEHYKRVPRGIDKDHPRAELLKYNGLYVESPKISSSTLTKPDLVDTVLKHAQAMAPLHKWLVKIN